MAITLLELLHLFQSTLPHGSDPISSLSRATSSNFNPRSLTGATTKPHFAPLYGYYFNPRSLTGATRSVRS